jgi:3-oxoacyl-[acyl-carrier-protein] synthase-3
MNVSRIVGSGGYVPERVVPNSHFQYLVDDADEWIFSRTGIRERRFAAPDQATSDLATAAAQNALANAGLDARELDAIVLGTSTPDMILPATACMVQERIGAHNAFAFDVNSVCSSFVLALDTADSLIRTGKARTALVIGADTYSKILDFQDKSTCPLFGDGAAAVVLRNDGDETTGIQHSYLRSDGRGWPLIQVPSSGSRAPITAETIAAREVFFRMAGKKVFEFAVEVVPGIVVELCRRAGIEPSAIDHIIPHQANVRIIDVVAKRLRIPKERFLLNLERYGNTSGASVGLALDENLRNGTIRRGALVVALGFGGGLSWGGMLIRC